MMQASLTAASDPNSALELMNRVLLLQPRHPDAYSGIATLALALGRAHEAHDSHMQLLHIDSNSASHYVSLGKLLRAGEALHAAVGHAQLSRGCKRQAGRVREALPCGKLLPPVKGRQVG